MKYQANAAMHDASAMIDAEQQLILAYVAPRHRIALNTLFALDKRLGNVVASTTEPGVGVIRLAWWRDALAKLVQDVVPAEPLLQALAATPLRDQGPALAGLAEAWGLLLDPQAAADPATLDAHGRERGGSLFTLAGALMGGADAALSAAGAGWALVDLAFTTRDQTLANEAIMAARRGFAGWDGSTPHVSRPLGMLAILARRDAAAGLTPARRQGSPARIVRMIAYRLTGR